MEILHYPLIQFHVHLVIQNELFNWLPLETNMICSSTIYVQVTCSFTRFVLLQELYLKREFDIRNTCCWNFVYPLQPDSINKTPISNILSAICCHTYITWSWKKHLPCACECSKINKVKQKVTELQSWTKVCLNLYLFFSSGNNWPIDMAAWLCEWELWELPWDTHDACKITQENDHIFKMGIEETIGHNQASTKRILFLCTQKQPQWKKP